MQKQKGFRPFFEGEGGKTLPGRLGSIPLLDDGSRAAAVHEVSQLLGAAPCRAMFLREFSEVL